MFENIILADEPFAKALEVYESCVLFNNNLEKLVSPLKLPTIFDERFKFTLKSFFNRDFDLFKSRIRGFYI